MIKTENHMGTIEITETYFANLIGNTVSSCFGVVGMAMALSTYPIYKKMLDSRRKHYGPAILELSEKLMTTFSV